MTKSLLVVGLAGRTPSDNWERLLAGRLVLARSSTVAKLSLPANWPIAHGYDEEFDTGPIAGLDERIAEDVVRRSSEADVAYLVPGPGWIGDATVSALHRLDDVELAPGTPSEAMDGHVQAIDALSLAQAQEHAPFDAGIHPLDATTSTVVFNWHGDLVTSLAASRLRAVYGVDVLPAPNRHGTILIPARDPLDSPPSFAALEYITARLRRPDGCPWDREQTHESMLDDFASEVAEYAEAVQSGDWPHAAEELGDVLLNVLMQAQIGTEAGHFTLADILTSITAKLVRRHPHVFAGVDAQTPEDVLAVWNSVKQQERASNPNSSSKE